LAVVQLSSISDSFTEKRVVSDQINAHSVMLACTRITAHSKCELGEPGAAQD